MDSELVQVGCFVALAQIFQMHINHCRTLVNDCPFIFRRWQNGTKRYHCSCQSRSKPWKLHWPIHRTSLLQIPLGYDVALKLLFVGFIVWHQLSVGKDECFAQHGWPSFLAEAERKSGDQSTLRRTREGYSGNHWCSLRIRAWHFDEVHLSRFGGHRIERAASSMAWSTDRKGGTGLYYAGSSDNKPAMNTMIKFVPFHVKQEGSLKPCLRAWNDAWERSFIDVG